jgi:hypothetical protein
LPTPDALGTYQMSGGSGKVALVSTTTSLGCNGSAAQPCSAAPLAQIIDLVGYGAADFFEGSGAAPAPNNATADNTAALRMMGGCTETDNNATDFIVGTPNPRNTASPLNPCAEPELPSLTIDDVSLNEGDAGATGFTFSVSLSSPAGAGGVTFDIATADGSATVADNDYTAKSLTGQTISAGSSTYSFEVLVNGDTTPEANETFVVNVTNVAGANVADGQGQGTIQDDDPTPPVAVDDSYITNEDSVLSLPAPGVLGNDTDPDNDGLMAALVSGPAADQGALVLDSYGSFTFTPAANFNGAASFTYTANDGAVDSNVATVAITVTPVVWSVDSSGTTTQLLSVACPMATLCKAVGVGGTIRSWNGTSWSADTSGTTLTFLGVACPTATLCKAVGANGTIRSWNGASWSADTSGTTQFLVGVACPTTTLCKAVGTNGTIRSRD